MTTETCIGGGSECRLLMMWRYAVNAAGVSDEMISESDRCRSTIGGMEEALPPAGAAPGVEPTAPSVAEGAWKRVDPRTILAGRLAGGVGTAFTAVAILLSSCCRLS